MRFDGIVLAGGRATRLGGGDKALVEAGGMSFLDRALEALAPAQRTVVVGLRREVGSRSVLWTEESPAGGGPAAALGAGLEMVGEEWVAVLAVDMPLVDAGLVAALAEACRGRDGAVLVDGRGRAQPLAAIYRVSALRHRLDLIGPLAGAPVTRAIDGLRLGRVTAGARASDCDTWAEVDDARRRLGHLDRRPSRGLSSPSDRNSSSASAS